MNIVHTEVPVIAGSLSPTGRNAALLSFGRIHVTDLYEPCQRLVEIPVHAPGVPTTIQWHPSPHKQSLILSTASNIVHLWDLSAPYTEPSLLRGHERAVASLDASCEAPETIVSGCLDGAIALWDLRDSRIPSQTLYTDQTSVRNVKLSPVDSNLLASTHGLGFHVWDLRKLMVPICSIEAHPYDVRDIEWHPHIRERLGTCSSDGTVKFWNFSRVAGRLENPPASVALDRVMETGIALSSIFQLHCADAVIAFGDEVLLLDCRVKRISDRRARVQPVKSWRIGQSRAVGIRNRADGYLQCLAIVSGNLHILELTAQALKDLGARASTKPHNQSPSVISGRALKRKPISAKIAENARRSNDFSGLLKQSMADSEELKLQGDKSSENMPTAQWQQTARVIPESVADNCFDSIEDEDDDFAVIVSENPATVHEYTKVSIVPSKRVSGAIFAPNGVLIRFRPLNDKPTAHGLHQPNQDFRGITRSLCSYLDEGTSDGEIDFDTQTGEILSLDTDATKWSAQADPYDNSVSAQALEVAKDQAFLGAVPPKSRPASTVGLYDMDRILPTSRDFAESSTLTGTPFDICVHNRKACDELGLHEHAQAWAHAALMLKPTIPLQQSAMHADRHIVARRNLVEIKRHDGRGNATGLDFAYDDPKNVAFPSQRAPIYWANHPFGRTFIKNMLRNFMIQGDIQMLAMLTTVFTIASPCYMEEYKHRGTRSGLVKIKFKRLANLTSMSLATLDDKDFHVHCQWRLNYADQLNAWGLPIARLEILQTNNIYHKREGVMLEHFPSLMSVSGRRTNEIAACSVCWEIIRGQCIICSECEHAYHPACKESYLLGHAGKHTPCAAGCGCCCGSDTEMSRSVQASHK